MNIDDEVWILPLFQAVLTFGKFLYKDFQMCLETGEQSYTLINNKGHRWDLCDRSIGLDKIEWFSQCFWYRRPTVSGPRASFLARVALLWLCQKHKEGDLYHMKSLRHQREDWGFEYHKKLAGHTFASQVQHSRQIWNSLSSLCLPQTIMTKSSTRLDHVLMKNDKAVKPELVRS